MSQQFFPIKEMLFKTRVGGVLKYCITWLDWDPSDMAMVRRNDLINYTDKELKKVKTWKEYKKKINYNSTFENYAKEKNINLTCTYPELVVEPVEEVIEEPVEELVEEEIIPKVRKNTCELFVSIIASVVMIILHLIMLFLINYKIVYYSYLIQYYP